MFAFVFSHFSFIGHVLNKLLWESVETYISVTHMENTGLVYSPVKNAYAVSIVLAVPVNVLINLLWNKNPLVRNLSKNTANLIFMSMRAVSIVA